MGQKADQSAFPSTFRPESQQDAPPQASRPAPPALPPRSPPLISPPPEEAPPAYTEIAPIYHSQPVTETWSAQDPRSSSTQSLIPHGHSEDDNKRRLLLIWVHGFMGNETSFQSFPAHVHNALSQRLQDAEEGTHVVHTKIYPRYKSRNKIEIARNAFSDWLAPHEDANTDVILLGHSLGGILSAEVVMKPAFGGEHMQYRHRILGTINFDTPFLGMHPGVISSGLGSLFRPAPDAPTPTVSADSRSGSAQPEFVVTENASETSGGSPYLQAGSSQSSIVPTETLSTTTSTTTLPLSSTLDLPTRDPNYDPPFTNDVRQPQRSGWSNAWHFINKHADGATLMAKSNALSLAAKSYVTSHFEFGGCLADYNGLKVRYRALKDLEDGKGGERVRFVNYYTASTGRPKKEKPPPETAERIQGDQIHGQAANVERNLRDVRLQPSAEDAGPLSPRISGEEADQKDIVTSQGSDTQHLTAGDAAIEDGDTMSDASSMARLSPAPVEDSEDEPESVTKATEDTRESPNIGDNPENLHSTQSDQILAAGGELPLQPSQPAIALPPIPALPKAPLPFDPAPYTDKDARKLAEKEHTRTVKNHERLVKDRDRSIKDRRKLIEKREAAAKKEREKSLSALEKERARAETEAKKKMEKEQEKAGKNSQASAEKERLEEEKGRMDREARRMRGEDVEDVTLSQSTTKTSIAKAGADDQYKSGADDNKSKKEKPQKDKKFCLVPPPINGKPDPCWIRVFMPGVDEVGAHCGLFFVDGQRYEWFVGDVAERVKDWIAEARK